MEYHVRSISLPSRLNPSSIKVKAELQKLTSLFSPSSPSSTQTTKAGLVLLAELYNAIEQLIQSPHNQQAIPQHQHGLLEEPLEGSVELLDSCGKVRDLFIAMKEQVQELQSALRRKGGDSSLKRNISAYICFRKKVKKDIAKSLRALKHMENEMIKSSPLLDLELMKVLREATAITVSVFRSLLVVLSWPVSRTKPMGWSLISKLMTARSEASQMIVNEVGMVDFAISTLHGNFPKDGLKFHDLKMAQRRLQDIESSLEGFESGLDCLFRRLIQTRVSLLNILAH